MGEDEEGADRIKARRREIKLGRVGVDEGRFRYPFARPSDLLLGDVDADKPAARGEHPRRLASPAAAQFEDVGLRWKPPHQFAQVARPRITSNALLPRRETISHSVVARGDDLLRIVLRHDVNARRGSREATLTAPDPSHHAAIRPRFGSARGSRPTKLRMRNQRGSEAARSERASAREAHRERRSCPRPKRSEPTFTAQGDGEGHTDARRKGFSPMGETKRGEAFRVRLEVVGRVLGELDPDQHRKLIEDLKRLREQYEAELRRSNQSD